MKNSLSYSIRNAPKLSPDEGGKIKEIVDVIIDVLVKVSGGKPWFGGKKK